MDKIINIEILGHPLNIAIVLLMIALFWFALFATSKMSTNQSTVEK